MKAGNFTGIPGIPNQDIAMWETMGRIADRSKDWLGTSDIAVARFRRLMVDAAIAMRDTGVALGTTQPHIPHASIASFEGVVPKSADWRNLGGSSAGGRPDDARRNKLPDRRTKNLQGVRHHEDSHCRAARCRAGSCRCRNARAFAQDTLKLAVGQRGNWDTSVSEVGQRAGIFKKHGLVLEIVYTQGAGETQQAVISGSVDIGVAAGVMGVLSAFSKGAPVRIIGAETTGAADLYWYVKSDSPIKTLKDTDGKTMAYSTNGSSTHGIVTAFVKQYGITPKLTATGGPPGTLTQVMSGQIDVGWAAPPFGLDQLDKKEIRVIASGNDASVFAGQTVRLNITTAPILQSTQSRSSIAT